MVIILILKINWKCACARARVYEINVCMYLSNYSSLQCSWDLTVSVIHRDVVFHERRHGTHRRTFMRTNDANDNPPNSRRPSLQTITPVALIFSWLLFDGTTRKCIIRRSRSPTAVVVELLQLESRLFLPPRVSSCSSSFSSSPSPCRFVVLRSAHPALSLRLSNLLPAVAEENVEENATYVPSN